MHLMCVLMYILYAQRAYLIHIRGNDFQPSTIWFITFLNFHLRIFAISQLVHTYDESFTISFTKTQEFVTFRST